jgi:hypothetical protein
MFRAGSTPISASGATSIGVSFGYTFATIPATVVGTVSNITDSSYLLLYPFVAAKTTTGCTFELNGATDSTNYTISWMATDDSSISGGTSSTGTVSGVAVAAKSINRLPVRTTIAGNDYMTMQSNSGGYPVTVRVSLDSLKTFLNS